MSFDYPTRYPHEAPPVRLEEVPAYLDRELRRISQAIEAGADGFKDKTHVEPTNRREGMIRYADGVNWDPGSGQGYYIYIAAAWRYLGGVLSPVLASLFNANTILKADADDTPLALSVPVQTLIGRITAGVITALTPAQIRTLINVEDNSTADQTDAEIKTGYENNANTNAFTDALQTKLNAIEALAEVNDLTLLATATASASSTISFDSGINFATYKKYVLEFIDIVVSNDGADLWLRTSTDGGTSYDAGTSYRSAYMRGESGSSAVTGVSNADAAQIVVVDNIGNAAGESASGKIVVYNPSNASLSQLIQWDSLSTIGVDHVRQSRGGGMHNSHQDVDGLRILPSAGTLTTGELKLYGVV